MREHKLQYNEGAQTIYTVVSSELGFVVRPSSATFQLVDARYSDTDSNYTLVAPTAATVDALSTATTTACGRSTDHPSVITLDSVAGVTPGRRYLLTNPSGQSEMVTVVSVQAGPKTVLPNSEPHYNYPIGSTFTGLEVSAAVPSAIVNDDDYFDARLFVVWTFVGVSPSRFRERLELVRPQPSWATVEDMLRLEQGLSATQGTSLVTALGQAHFDFFLDLRAAGLNPYTHNPGPLGTGAVTYLACYHVLKDRADEGARERATAHLKRYDYLRLQLVVGKDKAGVSEVNVTTGADKPLDIRSYFGGL